ncbi:hypothetical protein [Leucobacter tenebrionis]|uniref:hypothetical protein n=1 Tax=Leucobacter tenebrionis TaxID=2873270 RepID=UPI001CA61487|nr:hypothetical protein [Leucobacter tenebrionis]QZY50727.1 hypothetical protein KVY00_08720 [Leucobacter tenebrionis]
MRINRSPLHGSGLAAPSRTALLVALITLAVIVGLAAMHTLSLHCASSDSQNAAGYSVAPGSGSHAQPHAELTVAHLDPPPAVEPVNVPATPAFSLGGPPDDGGLDPHAPGLALLCVLVLFISLLLPERRGAPWLAAIPPSTRPRAVAHLPPMRPPSLDALGISRT